MVIGDNTSASGFLLNIGNPFTSLPDPILKLIFKDGLTLSGIIVFHSKVCLWWGMRIPRVITPALSNEVNPCVFLNEPLSLSSPPQLRTAFMLAAGSAGSSTGDIFFPLLRECKLHWRYIRWLSFQLIFKAFLVEEQMIVKCGLEDAKCKGKQASKS